MYKNYNDLKSDFIHEFLSVITRKSSLKLDDIVQLHINNLIHHECFTIDFFEKNINNTCENFDWRWRQFSKNPNLTLDFIEKHIDEDWDWKEISRMTILTNDFIDKYSYKPFSWILITQNKSIKKSEDFIRKYHRYNLNWKLLSSSPDITLDFISNFEMCINEANPNLTSKPPWHWWEVSKRKDVTIDFIERFKHYNLDWTSITKNENLSLDKLITVLDGLNKVQWGYWYYLSLRDDISEEIINKYPNKKWNWWWISKNGNITWDIIKRNMHWKWDWSYVATNPNITLDIIKQNPDYPWDFKNMAKNLSTEKVNKWIECQRLKVIAARRIHRFWRDISFNPDYKYARKKLEEEYEK